jgi:hypothetical protein
MKFGRQHSQTPKLYAHSDASFANPYDQMRSRSGGVIWYDNTVLLAYSKKQTTTALNTMEAELYAAREIVKHVTFYIELFKDFNIDNQGTVIIYIDNIATLHFIDHPTGNKSRHLEVCVLHLRELVRQGIISWSYIFHLANSADFYTNIRSRTLFDTQRDQQGMLL